jgi:hypothetical protein
MIDFNEIFYMCYSDSCGNLKVGILANLICLYLGLYVTVSTHKSMNRSGYGFNSDKTKNIVKEFFSHHGYSLYLVSGGALIGVIPFESAFEQTHLFGVLIWLVGLLFLLNLEVFKSKDEYFSSPVSFSRVMAFPVSFVVIFWVWSGAVWFS